MKHAVFLATTVATVGLVVLGAHASGLHINTSHSMPLGVWIAVADKQVPPLAGEAIAVCLPEAWGRFAMARGYISAGKCPGGAEPVLKQVLAVPGDTVRVDADGLAVNDKPIANTKPLSVDAAGRPLRAFPAGTYVVRWGDVWVAGDGNPRSMDSRYFGPVAAADVVARLQPLVTF
jgi:conjugative transfer signal peptidase TraF